MEDPPAKRRKVTEETKEELLLLDKEELVEKVLQYQKHNIQLKNIISKSNSENLKCVIKNKKKEFDFTKCHFRRIFLRIMYFGWDYQGFVVQEDSANTIEHKLFQALTKSCLIESREMAQYHRCGRTDKGVSAFGQVISLTIRSKHPPEDQYKPDAMSSEIAYCTIINRLLPEDIKVVAWMPIPSDKPEYSARFDCKKRQYKYYFPRAQLDVAAMRDACARLVGSHDFRHLCKMDVGNGVVQYTRKIFTADIVSVNGTESTDCTAMYCLLIEGNAFLWHQIRCIMGVLLLVGEGKEAPDVISELLDIEKNTRKPQYNMAIDVPLNLFQCSYDLEDSDWVYPKDELRQSIVDLQKTWTMYNIKTTMMRDSLDQLETVYSTLWKGTVGKEKGTEENRVNSTLSKKTNDKEKGNEGDRVDLTLGKEINDKEKESEGDRVIEYASGLRQGINSRVYKPLFERQTCCSLEERIEYYKRKRAPKEATDKIIVQEDQPQSNVDKL